MGLDAMGSGNDSETGSAPAVSSPGHVAGHLAVLGSEPWAAEPSPCALPRVGVPATAKTWSPGPLWANGDCW